MAKIVIAGRADCPYYAKIELLGDYLMQNLPDFNLHKVVIKSEEWETWLKETCASRGWEHAKSPLVWRELVQRGGKGALIGGANEFQEYVYHYYNVKSNFTSIDMKKIGDENLHTKKELDEEWARFKALSHPVKVCITNATSGTAYCMVNSLCNGSVFGKDTEVSLCFLGGEDEMEHLAGTEMEAFDLAHPLLRGVKVTSNVTEAFTDSAIIVHLDEIQKNEEESKEEWLKRNQELFTHYGQIINKVAASDVRVLVCGAGPLNFNTLVLIKNCPRISRQNIVACPRLIENQAKAILSEKLKVNSAGLVDTIIWGNINGTHEVDLSVAKIHGYDGAIWGPPSFSIPLLEMLYDKKWLEGEFYELPPKRKEIVEAALKKPKDMSHAAAVATLLGHWCQGCSDGRIFSLGVYSEGLFGIPEGIVFSGPVNFSCPGNWTVVQDVDISEAVKEKLEVIAKELLEEQSVLDRKPETLAPKEPAPAQNEGTSSESEDPNAALERESSGLSKIKEDKEGEERAAKEATKGGEKKEKEEDAGDEKGSSKVESRPESVDKD